MVYEIYLVFGCALLSLIYGAFTSKSILSCSDGDEKMKSIARAIQEGAHTYLNRQYSTIFFVGIIIAAFLYYVIGFYVSLGFVIGAILSGLAGYIGMIVSVRANVRTAQAAKDGLQPALDISF